MEDVREAHYNIASATGVDIEKICAEYGERSIPVETAKVIEKLGWLPDNGCIREPSPKDMAKLWVFLLNTTDPSLGLKLIPDADVPMLPFYGFDEKNRHINFVGYGLFE